MFSTIVSCIDGKSRAIASMLAGFSPGVYLAVMAVTILLGNSQPARIINMIASMNAVVFGLLGFVLLYLDRKLPAYARCHPVLKCVIIAGSTIFLGVAFLKLL